ncbi:MAG: phospho-sugar mutase [Flavobacteriales bacterium]
MTSEIEKSAIENAKKWLSLKLSSDHSTFIKTGLNDMNTDFVEAFYKDLEFGTGGMRGVMGVGPNRINTFTLGLATQALAEVLLEEKSNPKVAIAFDSRHNSLEFSNHLADILSANGVEVLIYKALRPTPQLSFTIREFNCDAGIVITASHNPPEYNGYKVYGADGCQITAPFDQQLISRVRQTQVESIKSERQADLVRYLDTTEDQLYFEAIKSLSLDQKLVSEQSQLPIVYTGLHGTGARFVKQALEFWGFGNVIEVEEQASPDGNFPTVKSPNPEEPEALKMAIELAKKQNAELVLATDPDADRVGIAVRNNAGQFELLNGNETASLLVYYVLNKSKLTGNEFIAKTVVTSDVLDRIAECHKVDCVNTLTGFKHIGAAIKALEGKKRYLVGGEESYGYLIGDLVRDKDAVSSCCMIAEICAWAKAQNKTMIDLLKEVRIQHGFYKESLNALTKKGIDGLQEIKRIVENFRANSPKSFAGEKIIELIDYQSSTKINLVSGKQESIAFPSSNFMQFITEKQSKITVRPSGTEPKIKFYISVCNVEVSEANYAKVDTDLQNKIECIQKDLGLTVS